MQAVLNRPYLGAGEIRRALAAREVVYYYEQRKASENWVAWAEQNPRGAEILALAEGGEDGG